MESMKGVFSYKRYLVKLISLSFFSFLSFSAHPLKTLEGKEVMVKMEPTRPNDLVILKESTQFGSKDLMGIYNLQMDKQDKNVRRFNLWHESGNGLEIHNESVRCSPKEPMRVKRRKHAIYLKRLNPGGLISLLNKEDHLVWWAACIPELAGSNPKLLHKKALELGYSTNLLETVEVLITPN